jgi:hypothetical protein
MRGGYRIFQGTTASGTHMRRGWKTTFSPKVKADTVNYPWRNTRKKTK